MAKPRVKKGEVLVSDDIQGWAVDTGWGEYLLDPHGRPWMTRHDARTCVRADTDAKNRRGYRYVKVTQSTRLVVDADA